MLVLVVEPSPKSQKRLVIVPVEVSVKLTVNGLRPLVGLPVKAATGTTAPVPVTVLVALPALSVVKITLLLKVPALPGAKLTTRLVEPNPGKVKCAPDGIENAPAATVARPLLRVPPPRLVIVKLAWEFDPTATVPKLIAAGETAIWGGVKPEPRTVLVLFPPLVRNVTALLKAAALGGLNATWTNPV